MAFMFNNCPKLEEIGDVSKWKFNDLKYVYNMFSGCKSLKKLDCENWNVTPKTIMTNMFAGCSNLEKLPSWYNKPEEEEKY
jgi:surface protein